MFDHVSGGGGGNQFVGGSGGGSASGPVDSKQKQQLKPRMALPIVVLSECSGESTAHSVRAALGHFPAAAMAPVQTLNPKP